MPKFGFPIGMIIEVNMALKVGIGVGMGLALEALESAAATWKAS